VDVVPTESDDSWSRSPRSSDYEDGRVYGGASADMKGGLVSSLLALEALQVAGVRDAYIFAEPSGLDRVATSNHSARFFRIVVPGQ
jgi:acetylornithine deacetylase/succinyl-diaminopimelate desuccinylase-like protein